ncbi:MAG TPA: hypothetical protein VGR28_07955 [Candidatus Thermoplasmatota archaeon]|jgi:hypothetical protein|nr:hypothetical protein [Candidatus Thermoplasmatota archaeon]
MAAWRAVPLAALLLGGLLAPAVAQPGVQVHLAGMVAGYGAETWKDEPPVGDLLLQAGLAAPGGPALLGVYRNPYLNATHPRVGAAWLGYNVTLTLEVRDARGQALTDPTLYIEAKLATAGGEVPAKLARVAPGRFAAQLDLDGENGAEFPAVSAGAASLVVEVQRASASPGALPTRVATAEVPVQVGFARLDRGGFLVPEALLPGYADVGPGNQSLVQELPVAPGTTLAYTADLGAPNASARVVAWHRGAATWAFSGRTDALGRFPFAVAAGQLTGDNGSGLVVLEAHLDGSGPLLASAPLMVAVSSHALRVVAYDYREAGAAGQRATALDTLDVTVEDPTAGGAESAFQGNVTALDDGGGVLAASPFQPSQDGSTHVASLPVLLLAREGLSSYRVLALLQQLDGRLYGMAHAFRGYALSGGQAEAAPFERGSLPVVVRNFNNNLDDRRDPGLALPVKVVVEGLPGGGVHEAQANVEESSETRLLVPFSGDLGDYPVTINTSSGELRVLLQGSAVVRPPDGGLLGLPGPEVVLAALALAVAAFQRRTRA